MLEELKSATIGIILPICLFSMFSICASCSSERDTDYRIEYIPVKLENDSDWSFISKDGKIKYENEFNNRPSYVINGLFSVEEGNGLSVYRADGDKPEFIKGLENLREAGYYNYGLLPVCFPGKRISIVNIEGNEQFELLPVKGKEIISCSPIFLENMLRVETEDNKIGYYNTNGDCVIPPIYSWGGDFSEGKAVVLKDSTWFAIDKKGNKLFSFKKGLYPPFYYLLLPSYNKFDRICMEDEDGRFYMYDGKGEVTKLSNKIKDMREYTDKYLIFVSESEGTGLMSVDGEVIIRPKYASLSFYGKNKLLACRKDKEWEILDYSGDKINTLDYSDVSHIDGLHCIIAGEQNNWTIINSDGTPVAKNTEFYGYYPPAFPSVQTCYIPKNQIIKEISEMITPEGVLGYKFGSPMKDIPEAQELGLEYIADNDIFELCVKPYSEGGMYDLSVSAFSDHLVGIKPYSYFGSESPYWNPYSKLELFRILISTHCDWGREGVSEMVNLFKNEGYVEFGREEDNDKSAIYIAKNEHQIIIGNLKPKIIVILYTKGRRNEWTDNMLSWIINPD